MKDKFYYSDGTTSEEYKDDEKVLHREDGPAIECADGTKFWYRDGDLLRREDGPAGERFDGSKFWHHNGVLHREDGPAAEFSNGDKEWWVNGKRHRVDGPAEEFADGSGEWYINGKCTPCIPRYVLFNYMKTNNLTAAHLLTDPDPLVRESASKYIWT